MTDRPDGTSLADQLSKLAQLRDSGAITPEEFETAKQRVLGTPGMGAAPTVAGRAAAPEGFEPAAAPPRPAPGDAPPPLGSEPLRNGALGPLPTTEVLPDVPAEGFTLGDLRGEDDGTLPSPSPPPPGPLEPAETLGMDSVSDLSAESGTEIQLVSTPGVVAESGLSIEWKPAGASPGEDSEEPADLPPPGGGPSEELGVADLLGEESSAADQVSLAGDLGAGGSLRALPGVSADDQPLELDLPPGAPSPGMEPPGMEPPNQPPSAAPGVPPPGMPPPAVAPGYMYGDSGAEERRAVKDLGGSVTRTAWMIGGGVLLLVVLLLTLSSGFRMVFGGGLVVIGVLAIIAGSIWMLVAAAQVSVVWLLIYLFVPFGNFVFMVMNWAEAKWPMVTQVVGVVMFVLGLFLYVNGADVRRGCKADRRARSGETRTMRGAVDDGDDGDDDPASTPVRTRRRPVQWRPAGAFSCAVLQDRVDDCEEDWADQLEQVLKRTRVGADSARISVDRPRVAVKQAQTLVFENGELHRCQVAVKRKMPMETEWLGAVKGCLAHKQCKDFAACHAKVFLRYIGQIPFSCRFYCNKEMYQCGAAVVGSNLQKNRGYKVQVDEDRLDEFRPKLFAKCLRYCKKRLKSFKVRESVLQCMFQPTCAGFVSCREKIADE